MPLVGAAVSCAWGPRPKSAISSACSKAGRGIAVLWTASSESLAPLSSSANLWSLTSPSVAPLQNLNKTWPPLRLCADCVPDSGLRRTLNSYYDYYHGARAHLSLKKVAPETRPVYRRSGGRSWNCRGSADCITVTHAGRLEELFSGGSGVFSDLESTAIREASGPVGAGLPPSSHRHQTSSPCLFCYPVDP